MRMRATLDFSVVSPAGSYLSRGPKNAAENGVLDVRSKPGYETPVHADFSFRSK
jgi:uncharacterized protein YfaP (DUF2135 family)